MKKGKEIPKSHIMYNINQMVFIEWKFIAFMKEKIEICKVINECTLQSMEDNAIYEIDNKLIDKIYEAEDGFDIIKKEKIEEQKFNYLVSLEMKKRENYSIKHKKEVLFFEYKKINNNEDLEEFKKFIKKNIESDGITTVEFITGINLLSY